MPARQLDKAEMREIVRLALDSLGERQRLAVLLNKFEGMSYADIAETMELSLPGDQVAVVAGTGEPPPGAGTVFHRGAAAGRGKRRHNDQGQCSMTMPSSLQILYPLTLSLEHSSHVQPQDQLDPALQEQLVAYLDGELDAEKQPPHRGAAGQRSAGPRRHAAVGPHLGLLDELDTAPVHEGFTQTTLEMVAVAAAKDARARPPEAPAAARRLLVAAGLLAAGLAGFLAVGPLPDPNRQLLQDLPMLENLDQYREIEPDSAAPGPARNCSPKRGTPASRRSRNRSPNGAQRMEYQRRRGRKSSNRQQQFPRTGADRETAGAAVARAAPARSPGGEAPQRDGALLPVARRGCRFIANRR